MPFEISCNSCGARLAVQEAHIGKMVRCPTCQKTTVVADNRPGATAEPPAGIGKRDDPPRRPRRDDDDDRPRRSRDDDDDRPRRSRDDDDYDDRPRRRRGSSEGSGMAIASLVLGIIALLTWCIALGIPGLICGVLAIIFGNMGKANPKSAGMATAGLVMGTIAIGLWVVFLILVFAIGMTIFNFR